MNNHNKSLLIPNKKASNFKPREKNISLDEFLTISEEIRVLENEKVYRLFKSGWMKKNELTKMPYEEWIKGVKPLKLGVNKFEKHFRRDKYLIKIEIFKNQMKIWLYQDDWKGLINAGTYPLVQSKSFKNDEKGAIITPQMLAWLEDFELIRAE